jgi:hypothetical protein
MNREVHYEFTRAWAIDAGFSADEAETVAAADWDVDRVYNVHAWRNKGFHFAWLGANRNARRLLARAIATNDLVTLGQALHCAQDATGHGFWGHLWHWHGIDRWAHRGRRVRERIEQRSRGMLAQYLTVTETALIGDTPTSAASPPSAGAPWTTTR